MVKEEDEEEEEYLKNSFLVSCDEDVAKLRKILLGCFRDFFLPVGGRGGGLIANKNRFRGSVSNEEVEEEEEQQVKEEEGFFPFRADKNKNGGG